MRCLGRCRDRAVERQPEHRFGVDDAGAVLVGFHCVGTRADLVSTSRKSSGTDRCRWDAVSSTFCQPW